MKISEAAKFESDLSKTNDIPPQSRGIKLQTFQLWGWGEIPGPPPPPPRANHDRNICKFRDYVYL